MQCFGCDRVFPTFTGITLHLESGTCASGATRLKVDKRVHELDTRGAITNRKRIGYGDWEPEPDIWRQNARGMATPTSATSAITNMIL